MFGASNYFLLFSFHWLKVFDLLNVPINIRTNLKVGKDYSNRECESIDGGYPINQVEANFEYYIIPRATKGQYQCSSIFDQQLKLFSESPNVIYRNVLRGNGKIKDTLINCGFSKDVSINHSKSGFWISYRYGENLWKNPKVLYILFDKKYLNLTDAHFKHTDSIPYDVYAIEEGEDRGKNQAKKLTVSQDDFWLQINIQSMQDGGVPFVISELRKLLDS